MKNEDIKLILDTQFTAVRGMIQSVEDGMNMRFDAVDDANKIRNHRIEKLENGTRVTRWFEKNPIKTIVIAAVFVVACIAALSCVDLRATISKQGVELKKSE